MPEIYTEQTKAEIERVLSVFRDFIDNSPLFDIVWSDKAGYILFPICEEKGRIIVGEFACIRIEDAPMLVKQLINEVVFATLQETGSENSVLELSDQECERVVQLLRPYMEQLPAYEHLVLATFMRERRHYSL